jgi:mRNA interferase YafQ
MRKFQRTAQFKRDVKRLEKRGKDLGKLREVLLALSRGEGLSQRYSDHPLLGQYTGTRECHLEPDWLLIYELTEDELILIRTGTHSDLFKA